MEVNGFCEPWTPFIGAEEDYSIWKLETQQLQRGFYNSKIQTKVHTD